MTLDLPPNGSVFVVFRAKPSSKCAEVSSFLAVTQRVDGPWQVQFDPKWGGPKTPVAFGVLTDWIDNLDPAIRHYSGTATYSTMVSPDALLVGGGRLVMSLGEVRHVADVSVNGRHVGTAWTYPFEVEIPKDVLGKGAAPFRLDIRVTNLWPNRLIADSTLPAAKRLTRTNINPYKPDSPLLSSGLLGPVKLVLER